MIYLFGSDFKIIQKNHRRQTFIGDVGQTDFLIGERNSDNRIHLQTMSMVVTNSLYVRLFSFVESNSVFKIGSIA